MTRQILGSLLAAVVVSISTLCVNPIWAANAERPLWLFVGADGGYPRLSSDVAGETSKDGWHLQSKALASFYTPDANVDLGLGWFLDRMDRITTKGFMAELAPRYRFNDFWQLGVVSNLYFGTDVEFGQTVEGDSLSAFAGVQAMFELPMSALKWRFVLQGTTDLNISDRQVFFVLAGIQLGLPLSPKPEPRRSLRPALVRTPLAPSPKPVAPPAVVVAPPVIPPPPPAPAPAPAPAPKPALPKPVILETKVYFFEVNRADLSPSARRELVDHGSDLLSKQQHWSRIVIEGQADPRGGLQANMKLAERRAQAAARALEAAGIDPSKMELRALAPNEKSIAEDFAEADKEKIWMQERKVRISAVK